MARLPGVDVFGFCLGGLAGDDAVDSFAVGLLRSQRQPELPAHNAGKEAAHRMLLPASRFHDRGDRYTRGLSEQGKDGRLLGPAAGRVRGSFPTPLRLFREALGAAVFSLVGGFAVRRFSFPFGCDGLMSRLHPSPNM